MPACVAALEQRTEKKRTEKSVSSGARIFQPPIHWGVLLLQTANNKKRQLMHSPYWLPHPKGSGPPLWGHLFTSWKLTFKGAFQSSFVCCYVPGGDEMCFKICIFKGVVACRSIKRNSLLCTSLCWTLLQNDHQSKLQPLVNLPLTVLIRRCYTIPNPNALIS